MIAPEWRRIAGLFCQSDGVLAVAWLAHDKSTDVVHLYDTATFNREPLAVISEGIAARGRWIPLAWTKEGKALADELMEKGLKTLKDPIPDSALANEMYAIQIQERMRSHRFKVEKRLGAWLAEMKTFRRDQAKMPRDGFPLMAATQTAVGALDWALRQHPKGRKKSNYPKVSIV